jgi:hypothetical protein
VSSKTVGSHGRTFHAVRAIAAVLVFVFDGTACWQTHLRDCSVQCGAQGACPSGMTCSNGFCAAGMSCAARVDADDTSTDVMDAPTNDGDGGDATPNTGDGATDTEADDAVCPPAPDAATSSDTSSDAPEQITVSNAWSSSTISVCWDGSGFDEEKRWIREASADSWEAVSALRFVGWLPCTAAGADIRMHIAPACGARPPIGSDTRRNPDGLVFDPAVPGCARGHEACVRAYAVHRLGHALGFDHRDNPSDLPSGCTGAHGQVDSVMSYCSSRPFLGNALLGAGDIVRVLTSYGAGPSPFIFQNRAAALRQVSTISPTGNYQFRALYNVVDSTAAADQVVAGRNGSLLLYTKAGGGRIDLGTLTADSNITIATAVDSIGTWKSIAAVQNGYYLFFDPSQENGVVSVRRVAADGHNLGEVSRVAGIGATWTDVVGLVNGEVFLFHGLSGTGQAARVTSDGRFELQGQAILGLPLYTSIAAVNVRNMFLYSDDISKSVGGTAELAVLGEDGEFQRGETQIGLPSHIEQLVGARNGSLLMYGDQSDPLDALHADVRMLPPSVGLPSVMEIPGLMAFDRMSAD